MAQTITMADVRRGWIDCDTCGDTLRIFYHQRCPTCHTAFTVPPARFPTEQEERAHSIEETHEISSRNSCTRLD